MPYIKPERRPDLDPTLQKLWNVLIKDVFKGKDKTLDQIKGDVNYCFTKILVTMLAKFGARYHILSNIEAIPKDVEKEFHEQFMKPYEKRKKEENGEVKPLIT